MINNFLKRVWKIFACPHPFNGVPVILTGVMLSMFGRRARAIILRLLATGNDRYRLRNIMAGRLHFSERIVGFIPLSAAMLMASTFPCRKVFAMGGCSWTEKNE
jgi:hypothetical protein